MSRDRGSTIPLILGFFVLAALLVAGSVALGQAFVQQRDLQDMCDGAATSAAASSADLDRGSGAVSGGSLRFAGVQAQVADYVARDPSRRAVRIRAVLSDNDEQITLSCTERLPLAFGAVFDRGHIVHTATSSARAAVLG